MYCSLKCPYVVLSLVVLEDLKSRNHCECLPEDLRVQTHSYCPEGQLVSWI